MKKLQHQLLLTLSLCVILLSGCAPKWEVNNPYETVNWENAQQYKANFHTHTTRSDGAMSPNTVVDRYHKLGYKILAITDHNELTYPWTSFADLKPSERSVKKVADEILPAEAIAYENRIPKELGMFDIQGDEISGPHHMGSYFSDYHEKPGKEELAIEGIGAKNGLIILNHPGRYTKDNAEKYSIEWYAGIFRNYEHVTGLEIYNQGDRYPNDRKFWDEVLTETMPATPVWGYSNDDFHSGLEKLGRNFNVMVLPELSEDAIRNGMKSGTFWHVYASNGSENPKTPQISNITVNSEKEFIEISVSGQDSIHWISSGKVVAKGNKIDLTELPETANYVRANIYGPKSITGIQPFGLSKKQ